MSTYFAIVHKDPSSAYGVVFPDVPGCFGAGDTYEEAVASAVEALRLHSEGLAAHGGGLPPPRTFEALLADADTIEEAREAAIVPISFSPTESSSVAVSLDLESGLFGCRGYCRAQARDNPLCLACGGRSRKGPWVK